MRNRVGIGKFGVGTGTNGLVPREGGVEARYLLFVILSLAMDHDRLITEPPASVGIDLAAALAADATAPSEACAPAVAFSKRALDVVISLTAIVVLMPLFVILAVLVALESPGPVLFRASRVGYGGRTFQMLKFRKMHHSATGPGLTVGDDARFTRVGGVLARLKLDELPQLWHVLRGEMSIVGPRPEDPAFAKCYATQYRHIIRLKPGLVGLSQIAFACESEFLDRRDPIHHYLSEIAPQKVALDLLYERRWSFWLDLRVIWWALVVVILRRPVAVNRRTLHMSLRQRRDGPADPQAQDWSKQRG